MYYKIALKNVKKSFKDYSIYFLTLTLAVCIFYSFNSIESQKAMIDVSMSDPTYMESFMYLISYISVFVAFILGGLILYANNFLIKRRNKELGIYMTLGMSKNKISIILILETFIVGIFSLISGLILGLMASQGISVLVSKLFDFKMSGYTFTISISAMKKTVLCFGIMFIIIMLFNSFIISKYKIIDLLTAGRKNEEAKFKNQLVYLIGFILCIISLWISYKLVLDNRLGENNTEMLIAIILGVIGTVLFFFSLSGFILFIIKKNKNIYFKGLNIFTVKQINSKVNTNFMSMSVICIMLFVTITVLTTGFTFKESLDEEQKQFSPFDATITSYTNEQYDIQGIKEILKYIGVKFSDSDKVVYYNEYINKSKISDIITPSSDVKFDDANITYMKISDYNKIRNLKNKDVVNLKDNEVLIIANSPNIIPSIQKYIDNNNDIKIEGEIYNIKNKEVIKDSLKTGYMNNPFTVIVNDSFCDSKTLLSSNVDINFGDDKKEKEENLKNIIKSHNNSDEGYDKTGYVFIDTKTQIYQNGTSVTSKALFVVIYIGLVFLISSMAVLALQQLSEASDSIDRYLSLKRLGVSTKSINKTIFNQTLIYFSIPVILALVHSIVGIKVANEFMLMRNKPEVGYAPIITASIFMIIYVIYFYITYSGYKNIVKNNIK